MRVPHSIATSERYADKTRLTHKRHCCEVLELMKIKIEENMKKIHFERLKISKINYIDKKRPGKMIQTIPYISNQYLFLMK